MLKLTLLVGILTFPAITLAQLGSSAGTLNQVHPDPAQQEFENEYDDLQKTVRDLDKPKTKSSEEKESDLPSNKIHPDSN